MKILSSELVDDDTIAVFQQRMGRHLVDGEDEGSDQERQNKPHTDTETPCTKLLHIKKITLNRVVVRRRKDRDAAWWDE